MTLGWRSNPLLQHHRQPRTTISTLATIKRSSNFPTGCMSSKSLLLVVIDDDDSNHLLSSLDVMHMAHNTCRICERQVITLWP